MIFQSFTSFHSFKMRGLLLSLCFALSALTANATLLEDSEYALILSRQAPGTPQFECHSNCGMILSFPFHTSNMVSNCPTRIGEGECYTSILDPCLLWTVPQAPERERRNLHIFTTNTFPFRQRPGRRAHPEPLRQLDLGRLLRGVPRLCSRL